MCERRVLRTKHKEELATGFSSKDKTQQWTVSNFSFIFTEKTGSVRSLVLIILVWYFSFLTSAFPLKPYVFLREVPNLRFFSLFPVKRGKASPAQSRPSTQSLTLSWTISGYRSGKELEGQLFTLSNYRQRNWGPVRFSQPVSCRSNSQIQVSWLHIWYCLWDGVAAMVPASCPVWSEEEESRGRSPDCPFPQHSLCWSYLFIRLSL